MSTKPIVFLFLLPCFGEIAMLKQVPIVSPRRNIHNISHPFRVKGDPKNCGEKKYELECDNNCLVLNLFSSGKYYVHAINYNNYTIRLVDVGLQQGNCSSLPLYYLWDLNFTNYHAKPFSSLISNYDRVYVDDAIRFPWDMAVALWVDCEKPVKKYASFTDSETSVSSCIGNAASSSSSSSSSSSLSSGEKRHYFYFGTYLSVSDVADQCKIHEIVMTTLRLPADRSKANISYSDFHSKLEYGFELSWLSSRCETCKGACEIGSNYSSVTCYKYCSRFWGKSSFRCA